MNYIYQSHIRTFFWAKPEFYLNNREEIWQWCAEYKCKIASEPFGWVEVPDDDTAVLFMMRWV